MTTDIRLADLNKAEIVVGLAYASAILGAILLAL